MHISSVLRYFGRLFLLFKLWGILRAGNPRASLVSSYAAPPCAVINLTWPPSSALAKRHRARSTHRAWLCRRIGTAEVPLGDSAFQQISLVFSIVPFWESVDSALVLQGFSLVPRSRSQLWIVFVRVAVPIPVLSSQFPVPRFGVSSSWFPVPASVQVGSQPFRARERALAPGVSTSSAKARELRSRHFGRHVFAQNSSKR